MDIRSALRKSSIELREKGIITPELDSRILLEHALEKDSVFLYANSSRPLTNLEYDRFRRFIRKREKGIPIAYVTGHKEFFGYDFLVNKYVLVPRPESEFLIEHAIENIKSRFTIPNKRIPNDQRSIINILDMGTGSGCLIISLAKELSNLSVLSSQFCFFASDISIKTLNVAKKNAKKILFEEENRELKNFSLCSNNNIKFFHSDLFSNRKLHKKFDVIIANLPYVPKEQISSLRSQDLGIAHEPQSAIFADDNGTAIIIKFLEQSKKYLSKNGLILIELDPRNAIKLELFARKYYPKAKIQLERDLAGLLRYLIINI